MSKAKSNKPKTEQAVCDNCGFEYTRNVHSKSHVGVKKNGCSPQCKRQMNRMGNIYL